MVVRCGCFWSVNEATRPRSISCFVVPPTIGVNISFDSPNVPWQLAQRASQISCPLATLPNPDGSPLKTGRTSMSQAATSAPVAVRPIPGNLSAAVAGSATDININIAPPHPPPDHPHDGGGGDRRSADLNITDLAVAANFPRLNGIVMVDRARSPDGPQGADRWLHISRRIDRPRLQNGG